MKVHEDVYVALIPTLPVAVLPNNQWYRRWVWSGCKRTPKSFDLVKIRAKSLKIREKSVESWAKCVKTFAMMCTDFLKWCPKSKCRLLNFLKAIFLVFFGQVRGHLAKIVLDVLWYEKNEPKMKWNAVIFLEVILLEFFSGKFGEIWAKILRTPKNLPASTPKRITP